MSREYEAGTVDNNAKVAVIEKTAEINVGLATLKKAKYATPRALFTTAVNRKRITALEITFNPEERHHVIRAAVDGGDLKDAPEYARLESLSTVIRLLNFPHMMANIVDANLGSKRTDEDVHKPVQHPRYSVTLRAGSVAGLSFRVSFKTYGFTSKFPARVLGDDLHCSVTSTYFYNYMEAFDFAALCLSTHYVDIVNRSLIAKSMETAAPKSRKQKLKQLWRKFAARIA